MKKILLLLIIILISANVFSADIHGVYVSTWNPGAFSKAEIDKTLNDAKKAHVTDLFIQVRRMDEAYYYSSFVRPADNLKEKFDMLNYVIRQAKNRNIKVHAWFVICRIAMGDYKKKLSEKQLSWLDKDIKGNYDNENNVFIDPSNYEARKYIASVIEEVVNKYKVEGVHLDYIRYPNANFGYSENSKLNYTLESGDIYPNGLRFDNFRREQITKLIREIRQKTGKNIILSASVTAWGKAADYKNTSPYKTTFQDYEKWLDLNLVDYVMPMVYKREHIKEQADDYIKWLNVYSKYKNRIVPAIGGYLNTSDGIKKQIEKTEKQGFKNWVIFDFNEGKDRENVINALK